MELPTPSHLRQTRIELGLTQNDLAVRAGVSQPLIARIEAGDVDPRLSTLRKILGAFDESKKEQVKASDIMHSDVICVSSSDSVDYAVNLMQEHGYSQLPVIDSGVPMGSISEDMIVHAMGVNTASRISRMKVTDLMGESFPAVSPNTDIRLVSRMLERYPAVLVVERGQTTGFVTKHDVIKLLQE
jgi:predicted transcriptional regulator